MKVDIIISADDIIPAKVEDKSAVVVDMLRATSVITTAVMNGCSGVIPVLTVERALEIAAENREKFVLGGERRALKIDGFDCSNSPLEYTAEKVKDKTLIITTTNGTRAINGSRAARNILIGSLLNGRAVAKRLCELDCDVVIVNAGTYGQFSMDDFICSGYIIECLKELCDVDLNDVAYTAHYIYENNKDIVSFIKSARHYNVMEELGFGEDIKYCCAKDITSVVPVFNGDFIVKG